MFQWIFKGGGKMSKEELTIKFNELQANKIIKGTEFVYIVKDENLKKYKIVDTQENLLKYSLNPSNHLEEQIGIIVTCECNNTSGYFYDAIFLEKFIMDSYRDPKIENYIYLEFNKCEYSKI